jgi:hypothetical protein
VREEKADRLDADARGPAVERLGKPVSYKNKMCYRDEVIPQPDKAGLVVNHS